MLRISFFTTPRKGDNGGRMSRIYVTGIAPDVTEEDMRELFSGIGTSLEGGEPELPLSPSDSATMDHRYPPLTRRAPMPPYRSPFAGTIARIRQKRGFKDQVRPRGRGKP